MRLPVCLVGHLKEKEVSCGLVCDEHQFYLTPENSQVYNLKANWYIRKYVWIATLWNFETFKTGTFKNIKKNTKQPNFSMLIIMICMVSL